MNSRIIASVVALAGSVAFAGNTCTWKPDSETTSTDWSDKNNYVEGVAPAGGNGDTIVVPSGKTVYLVASDAKSRAIVRDGFALIKMIGRFGEAANPALMVVTVGEDDDLTLNGKVLGYRTADAANPDAQSGLIVKRGLGALRLKSDLSGTDAYSNYTVEEGDFYLPQALTSAPTYHDICVSNNATLHIAGGASKYTETINCLTGEGVVTNSHANGYSDITLSITGECTFGGKLTNVRLTCKGGRMTLSGTESTMTSVVTAGFNRSAGLDAGGVIRMATVGMGGEPSSLGQNSGFVFGTVGGAFEYVGTGEVTDKEVRWQYPKTQMNFLSGGPKGGLEFDSNSAWNIAWTGKKTDNGMASLGLGGDNPTNVCVMAGAIAQSTDDQGRTNRLYITKYGPGIWRFKDNAVRTGVGGIAVREGTLQFDSLDEAGTASALGSAVDVHTNYWGAYDAAAKSDHVFELGGADTEGTLELTGAKSVWCTTRPAVLKGGARFKNSTANAFRFADVKNVSGTAQTVALDGSGMGENVLADVVDTVAAPVSVVKEGAGTWTFSNTNAIHGVVAVKGGTLKIRSAAGKYTWFLWTVDGVIDPTAAASCTASEFCLFRTNDLARVNGGMTVVSDYAGIQAGEAAFLTRKSISGSNSLSKLFDGANANNSILSVTVNSAVPSAEAPLPILMRLDAATPEIGRYDFSAHFGVSPTKGYTPSQYGCHPKSWTLKGSVDGLHWDVLHTISDSTDRNCGMPVGLYDDRFYASQSNQAQAMATGTNAHVVASTSVSAFNPLAAVSSVSVAAGAALEVEGDALELSKLKIDATGMGTLRNVKLASTGTLTVENLPAGSSFTLPGTYENVSGLENLAHWTLAGDRRVQNRRVVVKDGKVTLVGPGMMLIFR